ncbi:DUF805 domain-containing protein [Litorimonas haliclonae]|uniref:DUF805 domain-containing protein n=1 Tax=Litorimonas haliclonae TaxID=2081977 RepID=UPI0039EED785
MIKLFLSPAGRMGRRNFWIGVAGFILFCTGAYYLLDAMTNSMSYFWIFLIVLVLLFQMLYSVCGKRLHDIGYSYWPLTGMIVLIFVILIVVMLFNGGAEYFSEFSNFQRKEDIDPVVREAIIKEYQMKMKPAETIAKYLILSLWAAFTLWLGVAKPQADANKYGPVISG